MSEEPHYNWLLDISNYCTYQCGISIFSPNVGLISIGTMIIVCEITVCEHLCLSSRRLLMRHLGARAAV